MIIMSVKIDNLYSFNDFNINFSYPRKLKNSLIEYEYLEEIPTFRFKKLNIIMGTNSSGKTTFGKTLLNIFNFIANQNIEVLSNAINNKNKLSKIEIDMVFKKEKKYNLYRLKVEIGYNNKLEIEKLELQKTELIKNDTYEKAIDKLEVFEKYEKEKTEKTNIEKILEEINDLGWFFNFPSLNELNKKLSRIDIASNILQTFDNTIEKIEEVENTTNGYNIIFKNRDGVLLQNGKIVDKDVLSSGTEEALGIVYSIDQMIQWSNRPFYIDEKFSHAHSELEKSILNLMIELVGEESQLFFTTHNLDILTMNFPVHSFTFFSKDDEGNIRVEYPEEKIKRNDRNLINFVKNNLFDTMPKVEKIDEILEMVEGENEVK